MTASCRLSTLPLETALDPEKKKTGLGGRTLSIIAVVPQQCIFAVLRGSSGDRFFPDRNYREELLVTGEIAVRENGQFWSGKPVSQSLLR